MAMTPEQKAALEEERAEAKKHARQVEREVKRVLFSRRVPCRRYAIQCLMCDWELKLLIEKPTGACCPDCGGDLLWGQP